MNGNGRENLGKACIICFGGFAGPRTTDPGTTDIIFLKVHRQKMKILWLALLVTYKRSVEH
jgi:hypothetical protein